MTARGPGRPPAPWLVRCFEVLEDGRWREREVVLAAMMKVVPPGIALRQGQKGAGRGLTEQELIRRGARKLCTQALRSAKIEWQEMEGGVFMLRLKPVADPPPPMHLRPQRSFPQQFPQFDADDEDLTNPLGLLQALRARLASEEADEPHGVLWHDPESGLLEVWGPYQDAHQALLEAEAMMADFNQPKNNDGLPIVCIPIRMHGPVRPIQGKSGEA